MTNAFLAEDGRLRSGWRVAIVLSTLVAFWFISGLALMVLIIKVYEFDGPTLPPDGLASIPAFSALAVVSVATIAIVFLARYFLDRRPVRSLGFGRARMEVPLWFVGLAGGGGLIVIQVGIVAALGGLHWAGTSPVGVGTVLIYALILVAPSLSEEVVVRGYFQTNLTEGMGTVGAVVVSSAIFAIFHLQNPGQEGVRPLAVANIFLAGVLLGTVYLRTRSLPAVWGIHFGWNLFLGPIFGIPVSGVRFESLLPMKVDLVPQIGGGDFGLEGGLICTGVVGLAIVVAWAFLPRKD